MTIIWNEWRNETNVSNDLKELEGEVVASVSGAEAGSYETTITTESGKAIKIYHDQDCCESVDIEDAEVDDVVGGVVVFAGFVSGVAPSMDYNDDSHTWTFLKIDTTKGSIWQRWLGESNGYYSEAVDILGGVVVNG